MYLFFDTETTGLPRNWKAPVTDSENWPRMVQLAWIAFDERGDLKAKADRIILPEGFLIPDRAAQIHGITTERALAEGVPLRGAAEEFREALDNTEFLIAHNLSFDECIVGAEFHRLGMENSMIFPKRLCTMKGSTAYCRLPSRYGNKWPTLQELHTKLFGEGFEDAHNAAIDVEQCAKCFFELKRIGVIDCDTIFT